jgi:membrane-associated phospholipid phosphatase
MNKNSVTLFFTVALVFVYTTAFSQNLDINILKVVNLNRNTAFDWPFKMISAAAFPVAYGLPVMILMKAYRTKNRILKKKGWYMAESMVLSALVVTVLKYTIQRPRPFISYPFIEKLSAGGSPSFPSGHTSDAMAMAMALSVMFPRWYVVVPSFVWAGLVGYSRMDLGVHYPTDVMAGVVVGMGCSLLVYRLIKRRSAKSDRPVWT